ncbi:integrase [Cryobacterium sp. TMT1-2-1]|nr:integrase [Cryobacterium sp. TMT1-2-1]
MAVVNRDSHTQSVPLPDGRQLSWAEIVRALNTADIPDGTPYLIDDDGDLTFVSRVNAYLLEATRQRAYAGTSLRQSHAPTLRRLLLFVREIRGRVDLTATQRSDLIAYKEKRKLQLSPGSWNGELSNIANFFDYAVKAGWIPSNPIPRWGTRERNTLADRVNTYRRERFLTEAQLRFFLEAGLRGDQPADPELRPRYAERDYLTGLFLVSTGLRRAEARLVLDCEVPDATTMHPTGVHTFKRTGKGGVEREIWITDALVDTVDLYRATDRNTIIENAQARLRKSKRAGELPIVDQTEDSRGRPLLVIDGLRCQPERLSDTQRQNAVSIQPDGPITPLALFVVEGGLPPAMRTINNVFLAAGQRLANLDHPDLPPSHIDVTPHVMRHTFAVRMLAGLMRKGRETHDNPWHLLASPEITIQQLLGHADISTTINIYLYAAERYNDALPEALREAVARSIGRPGGRAPLNAPESDDNDPR